MVLSLHTLLRAGPFFIPKSTDVDDNGLKVRSPDGLRPLTLSNCDCKIITTAIFCGLHTYTIRKKKTAQRCTSSREMTDKIFEVETTALAHVTCATRDSGILLTDFAAAYSSVEKAEPPEFICQFLRMIYSNSMTEVEFAQKTRGQFLKARCVRQGCLAIGFLFAMVFDPIFQWLHDSIIPRNPAAPDFLQPSPCAEADDFAAAALSFRSLMTALSLAIVVVDRVAGLNLNHRKCCWVQYGSDSCHELLDWVSTNCEEFSEMKIVKYAKYVGTMIGPEGYLHSGTCKSLVERLVDLRVYAVSVLGYPGSISAPDGATTRCNALPLVPFVLCLLTFCVLDRRAALASISWGSVCSALPTGLERLPTQTHILTALRRTVQLVIRRCFPFSPFLPNDVDGSQDNGSL